LLGRLLRNLLRRVLLHHLRAGGLTGGGPAALAEEHEKPPVRTE
jgi:hypothetical protein